MKINESKGIAKIYAKHGFSNRQIRKILLMYNRIKNNFSQEKDLDERLTFYERSMLILGYNFNDIHELAATLPKAIFQKFEHGLADECYQKVMSKKNPEINSLSNDNRKKVNKDILLGFGFEQEDINNFLKNAIPLLEMSPKHLFNNIVFYLKCNITQEELMPIVTNNPTVLFYGDEEYSILFDEFPFFTKEIFKEIFIELSKAKRILQPDLYYDIFKFAQNKKLNIPIFISSLKKTRVQDFFLNELNQAYDELISSGFSESDANQAISNNFSILYKDINKIRDTILIAEKEKISKSDIIQILVGFGSLAGLKLNKIEEKIKVIAKYDLVSFIVEHPKHLIQSATLIEGRAEYLKEFFPEVTGKEYARAVFSDSSFFNRNFNPSKKELKILSLKGQTPQDE